jgi:hypothetical protein
LVFLEDLKRVATPVAVLPDSVLLEDLKRVATPVAVLPDSVLLEDLKRVATDSAMAQVVEQSRKLSTNLSTLSEPPDSTMKQFL